MDDLDALRGEIDDIDARLVELLRQRQDVVAQVMELKRSRRLPVRSPAREKDLVAARRAQAAAVGVDPDLVEELFRAVLRSSLRGQL